VEHPITEATLGIDIVEQQLRIASGEPLSITPTPRGHAIELRICAEDPNKRFFPQPGTLKEVRWPSGEGIRVDAGVESGSVVPPFYDSLLAKMIGWGETRAQAIERLKAALDQTVIEGIVTNIEMHKRILSDEGFIAGKTNTSFLEERLGLKA
jgi:acetyl/propionyl-CoA carboxylase alpha subunit